MTDIRIPSKGEIKEAVYQEFSSTVYNCQGDSEERPETLEAAILECEKPEEREEVSELFDRIADRVLELFNGGSGDGGFQNFILVNRAFLEQFFDDAIETRPDNNVYKEGLIKAYEFFSSRIGDGKTRELSDLKRRMRNRGCEK